MAGPAPFGRDDQPLLDVRIIGGRRVEIAVDRFGRPLNGSKDIKAEGESRFFTRSLSEERNILYSNSPRNSAAPPWIRGETPPKKVFRTLVSSRVSSSHSSKSNSLESNWPESVSSPRVILPPIAKKGPDQQRQRTENNNGKDNMLLEKLGMELQGFDTAKLKDCYLHLTGLDSTMTGFVDAEQLEQVFVRYKVPIDETLLNLLNCRFMSARRPNWVNYEQLLKFVSSSLTREGKKYTKVPKLDLSSNPGDLARTHLPDYSPRENQIALKPNQISPRSVNDGSLTGRQSTIVVKRAFQDRQDAHLLIEMERVLKQVHSVSEMLQSLRKTLEQTDYGGTKIINSQKLKSICLRHHLPFNGSLLDKILDRLDPKYSAKVNWLEFCAFVERAMPLNPVNSPVTSRNSQPRHSVVDTPPSQPTWETRQPLRALTDRDRVIPKAAAMEQEEMFDEHKKHIDQQLKEQSDELAQLLHKQQRHLDKRQKALQIDHIAGFEHLSGDFEDGSTQQHTQTRPSRSDSDLEEQHKQLLRHQFELNEQKRRIHQEQVELDKFVRDDGPKSNNDGAELSHVERFLRLANAVYLCDENGSGFIEKDTIRRLVKNYDLVYQLNFSAEVITKAIEVCSATNGLVSVDRLLDELKIHLEV